MNCLTEMYSAIEAEVPIPSDPTTTKNTELLNALAQCGRVSVKSVAVQLQIVLLTIDPFVS
jgi:hypothetical protein